MSISDVRNIGLATAITIGIAFAIPMTALRAQNPSLGAIRQLLDQGHYPEAEQQAEALFNATPANSNEQLDAGDLLIEASTRNGRGGQPQTLELAQRILKTRSVALGPDRSLVA